MGSGVPRWGLFLPTFNFQVQAQLAVRHAVTVSLHAVKLLYTSTFQWGLNVATHCCVEVHQCFIRDQPNTTEISQIQLAPAVTWHGGLLGCYWGPIACASLVGRTGCSVHSEFAEMQIPMIKKILYPFSLFPYIPILSIPSGPGDVPIVWDQNTVGWYIGLHRLGRQSRT